MYTATGFYFCCYLPELYANYVNKNANIYNLPEKILLLFGSILAFAYSLQLGDMSIIVNYSLALFIDCVAIVVRGYYIVINHKKNLAVTNCSFSDVAVGEVNETHDVTLVKPCTQETSEITTLPV